MRVGHAADQALTLAFGQRHRELCRFGWCLAGRENDFGYATAYEATEVEPRASTKLLQLLRTELGNGLILGQLTRKQSAKDVPHSPASTSRIRCQCVPAQ